MPSNFLEAVAKLITFLGFSIVISQYCPRRRCRRLHDSFQRLARYLALGLQSLERHHRATNRMIMLFFVIFV